MPAVESVIELVAAEVRRVPGVQAIVLGGSRARGTHTPGSDIDLGLYYDPQHPPDLKALDRTAARLDDRRQHGLVTPLGGWGPWINGGGWLQVRATPVDLLYRDLAQVEAVLADCLQGKVEVSYQPGHPLGFVSAIYLAEIAVCRPLWDPRGLVQALKAQVLPYPQALQRAIVRKFTWEIGFSAGIARKSVDRADVAYAAGCCFRAVQCMLLVLFALNREHWLNEKGALALAERMPTRPERLQARVQRVFSLLQADPGALREALDVLEPLGREVEAMCQALL